MNEYMASAAAQQFETEGEGQLPNFRPEDIDMAINEATTPAEQFAQIERKYGIPADVMERLEANFMGIIQEALVPATKPTEYQSALQQLLDLVEETMLMNQKTMPYEHPKLPSKLPLRVAQMIFPDFDPTRKEKAKADIIEEMRKIAEYNSPAGIKARAESNKRLADFFAEEEKRINDPEYAEKKRLEEQVAFERALAARKAEAPSEVVTSVKGDIESILKAVPSKTTEPEVIDLTDEAELIEDLPVTVREVKKTA
ncbi:hypothetical protein IT413_04110 [Candidatus Peregrinibacteria bacterium]|nr:hypothetical protein [Candidatus Peregrinibacteria bacterium]